MATISPTGNAFSALPVRRQSGHRIGKAQRRPSSTRWLFHDVQRVPVRVVQAEHRRDAGPAHDLADVRAGVAKGAMVRLAIPGGEADPGVDAGRAAAGRGQGDRRRRTGRRHLDPAHASAEWGVAPHLEPEHAGVEGEGAISVRDRNRDGADL